MAKKIRVAILFGGKSAEHEISLRSAKNVAEAIDKEKYDVVFLGIDKTGRWLPPAESGKLLASASALPGGQDIKSVALLPEGGGELSGAETGGAIDVVFPILHGPFGEDGTVQGLLRLANVAFVGAGVLGSAVGMDKDVMKRLLRDAGIPIGKFLVATEKNPVSFAAAKEKLGLPIFVKPANLGSSVGISKVKDESAYEKAVSEACRFDTKIVLEEFIEGREIECAVLGNENPIASIPGEVVVHHDFYSYEAKYLDDKGSTLEIPAQLPEETAQKVRELAIKTFTTLSCEGMGRVDSFLTKDGKIYVNEINTIPGFTNISMYPKLFEASGVSYRDLIDRLITLALERHARQRKLETSI